MPSQPSSAFSISRIPLDGLARHLRAALSRAKELGKLLVRPYPEYAWNATPPPFANPWQRYWGDSYSPDLKRWLLKPLFEDLEKNGKIGNLIVDIGSGAMPVTWLLPRKPARKRILIDIAADNTQSPDEQKIRLNVEKVIHPGTLGFRKALCRACKFLKLDAKAGANTARADTIIFSDILNYVDFREVLRGFSNYVKPGGRIIVTNLPMRGNQVLFSDKGLKDNHHLCQFFEEHHFEIEHKSFPCMPRGATDESEELIVLVARKCQ
jgi:hypothetical protein